MCSIIGYKGTFDEQLVTSILYNSRIRGLHSFGYSYYDCDELKTKIFLQYNEFKEQLMQDKPNLFIAHFRYSTSGDYKDIKNNQPLFQNQIAIAFNGVISQKDKQGMESEYNMKLIGDNDGYILLNKFNDDNFIKQKNISFAVVGLESKNLFAIRNKNRPLHISNYNNTIIIASTKDILNRSGIKETKEIQPFIKYEL
jgi:glutamine phosphoribosylpyrophosphate amidotransferase